MSDALVQLAERCEAAERLSYELDCAIWDTIYPGERDGRFKKLTARGQPYYCRLGPADRDGYVQPLRAFTASIDAAVTLVPDTCLFMTRTVWDGERTAGIATISRYEDRKAGDILRRYWVDEFQTDAATPALALCAASLRAMAGEGRP